jgi:hypothetical protein
MGCRIDREVAASRDSADIETEAARQAHYIRWSTINDIADPAGNELGYQRVVSVYIKYVMMGVNFTNKRKVRSSTVRGYAEAVNTLFSLRGFSIPANLSNPNNLTAILVKNFEKEENVASQRSPLDNEIFADLQRRSTANRSPDSVDRLMFNIVALGRIIGPRLSEYAQSKQDEVDMHKYPSGREVVKAFTANDFIFFDADRRRIENLTPESISSVASLRITWRIQKNRQNGQSINLVVDGDNPDICPVRNAIHLVLRAKRLGQPSDMPLAMYRNNRCKNIYLTGAKVAELLRRSVKSLRPATPKDELKKYSAHSLRVWACVLLDEAGMPPEFIKKRLRWLGDSFRMYLRDTLLINRQHRDALAEASAAVMDIIRRGMGEDQDDISTFNLSSMAAHLPDTVPEDSTMGNYADDMD